MSRTTPARPGLRWLGWLPGLAILAAVIVASLRVSEGREFARVIAAAQPRWLMAALLLQAATYLAQGEIWRVVARAARVRITIGLAYALSLTKLLVDQVLPSAGISGTVANMNALERRGVPRGVIMAGVVVHTASYYVAYVVCLGTALVILLAHRQASALLVTVSALFVAFAIILAFGVLALSGPGATGALMGRLAGLRPIRVAIELFREAESRLAHDLRLLSQATALQLAIVLLDAATVWALIRSLGAAPSAAGVFASFMVSTLFRTVAISPGGLGTFEAASVFTLSLVGVPVAVGLSATLLFRGLSFWLPMLPGIALLRGGPPRHNQPTHDAATDAFWSLDADELLRRLETGADGLSSDEAERRLARFGPNLLHEHRPLTRLGVLLNQLRSPLLLLLVFAAAASAVTGAWTDAGIVVAIVLASVGVGYAREYRAQRAAADLRARVRTRCRVLRNREVATVPLEEIVPGDIVVLSAGSLVPADCRILQTTDCFVNESVLTGESFPVEKRAGVVASAASVAERTNCVHLGTSLRSGTACCVAVRIGEATQFGAIAHRLTLRPPETEFERGTRRFGYLLTITMLIIVLLVFAANVVLGRPPIETLLFSIALAVGLSPELLPVILTVSLSRGAQMMAQQGVLVRRLSAIENLGSIDILCTDKTGTLTEGVVRLEGAYDVDGVTSAQVLECAALNAALQSGLANPLDEAILACHRPDLTRVRKLAEMPYDFTRKRLSVVVDGPDGVQLVTKGAFDHVLEVCTLVAGAPMNADRRAALAARVHAWNLQGTRVLAVAMRRLGRPSGFKRSDERELELVGFLTFLDQPKEGVAQALSDLARLGVSVKLITGDSRLVAEHIAARVGMAARRTLSGSDLDALQDEALWREAERTDLFVEVDPNQKERIILALKKMGHVVGFLGDGINDAPAMHSADTSLSVEEAVDVAREAADFVLLRRDLDVIRRGIEEGRKTFANTLKYILTTTSANLGNMVSMAIASVFLPFLPLLAGQILLNNFLSDIPAIGIADDAVDPEMVDRPRRWNIGFIGRFMIEFGLLSSLFDFLTFAVLLGLFAASVELFRTGWFVESLLSELVIALVVRTRRPFFRSRPGAVLLLTTLALVPFTLAIPFLPHAVMLGFVPMPGAVVMALIAIATAYMLAAEVVKRHFYRRLA